MASSVCLKVYKLKRVYLYESTCKRINRRIPCTYRSINLLNDTLVQQYNINMSVLFTKIFNAKVCGS